MVKQTEKLIRKWLPAVLQPLGLSEAGKILTKPLAIQEQARSLFRSISSELPLLHSEASLLHPERSPVPFGYREEVLKELDEWCYDDSHGWVLWKLVIGETGRGKTRLLMHLVEVLNKDDGRPWNAGFLDMTKVRSKPEKLLYLDSLPGDFLLVIDYAERFEPEVRAVLKASLALVDVSPNRRVRIVLISRRHSDLWKNIAASDMVIGDIMNTGGFSQFEPPPLGRDEAARLEVFDDAYAAFAQHFGIKESLETIPDLDRPGFNEVILIHLAALSLCRRGITAQDISEETLLDWILDRERHQWNSIVEARELSSSLKNAPIQQAAAYLTLVSLGDGIRSRKQAVAGLRNCPLLEGLNAPTLSSIAEIFHDLYPGPGWVNGVTPDLIGAYLLTVTDDDFIQGLYERIE